MGQRAYCSENHPVDSDQDADRWCEMYHRVELPERGKMARARVNRFVLKYPHGEFVAMDPEYGDPYRVDDIFEAHLFTSLHDAVEFKRQYPRENFRLYRVRSVNLDWYPDSPPPPE